ncbi:recombinase family protein [Geoalkalibacter halelectricus]|uniref:Recombinase family protein n=1 Tax=Geoalkalibacter halelectricus TaxID=2847045 RepID=A0ABY5ZP22_9BACT|nr:recombinase family protein [Geoalkalibacter halelectricus]MDO3377133.1 recombinase family protein [Geoalkalibacter halelectricus]UWZ79702.1 recombinase family protein [Geoalkalibacter halelectricus]
MLVGYARVSTVGQKLDVQLGQLKEAGVEKLFQEKASGAKADRPRLLALLDFVREGDTVIVTKLDRIARSTKDLLQIIDHLEEKEVRFRVLNINLDTATPTGKLMLTMLGAIATFEREMMLERQAEGMARAKAEGRIKGRPATARAQTVKVVELAEKGLNRKEIAATCKISLASVYRILARMDDWGNPYPNQGINKNTRLHGNRDSDKI